MQQRDPKTLAEVETLLKRLFKSGVLLRMPKTRSDAEVMLSLLAATLDPQRNYTEKELNDHLAEWLNGIAEPIALDHVSGSPLPRRRERCAAGGQRCGLPRQPGCDQSQHHAGRPRGQPGGNLQDAHRRTRPASKTRAMRSK